MAFSSKLIAVSAVAVVLALVAQSANVPELEQKYVQEFGKHQKAPWEAAETMKKESDKAKAVCESVHKLSGYGNVDIQNTEVKKAYVKFADSKHKNLKIETVVLKCTKKNSNPNNKNPTYTYYVTRGVAKDSLMFLEKVDDKGEYYSISKSGVIPNINTNEPWAAQKRI